MLLLPWMAYAACGLVLSLAANLLAFANVQLGGSAVLMGLIAGLIPLMWMMNVIYSKLTKGKESTLGASAAWRIPLSDCPAWMKYMTFGFLLYGGGSFLVLAFLLMLKEVVPAAAPLAPTLPWRGRVHRRPPAAVLNNADAKHRLCAGGGVG